MLLQQDLNAIYSIKMKNARRAAREPFSFSSFPQDNF